MRKTLLLAIAIVSMSAAHADSLYPMAADPTVAASLFVDAKAHKVGDILTVVITETANGTTTAGTSTSKNDAASLGPGTGPIFSLIKTLGLTAGNTSAATGTTSRSDVLSATIAVTVKQVTANGNMIIEGTRSVGNNNDVQLITLTGVVRQQDISPENTIQSPLIADAQIKYSGKGPVAQQLHQGLVTRIFKILF